jgi:peptidoglycan/LPS O-acetylase OafA/YrhL
MTRRLTTRLTTRLAWLEGIRFFAAVVLLVYHAQLLLTDYAYTPKPVGLASNGIALWTASGLLAEEGLGRALVGVMWFGYQFVDVFVLVSGFSLVLSLKGETMRAGAFVVQRCLRILLPFWTVAAIAYPVLATIGALTKSYIPDAWHVFAGLTFPLLFDYGGRLLLSTSGPWWFVPLILSFAVAFPGLWWLMERWGARNLLFLSCGVTFIYRSLAVWVFDGHPTYVIVSATASWFPFLSMLAKLSTFVLGMMVAQQFKEGKGVIFWRDGQVLAIGIPAYILGFVGQFYRVGWVVDDFLIAIGLSLLCMVVFRRLCSVGWISRCCVVLGGYSYSYFLVHNFVIDRTIRLWVHQDVNLYYQALPLMIVGTLGLAMVVDWATPRVRRFAIAGFGAVDRLLHQPAESSTNSNEAPVQKSLSDDRYVIRSRDR